jgi:hypothetical protein
MIADSRRFFGRIATTMAGDGEPLPLAQHREIHQETLQNRQQVAAAAHGPRGGTVNAIEVSSWSSKYRFKP